jgi:hypothetical protein
LNRVAVEKAAATIGIVDQQGLLEHLGMDISEPVSPGLVSTIVTRLPVAMSMAFLYVPDDSPRSGRTGSTYRRDTISA